MAFLLNKTTILSHRRTQPQKAEDSLSLSRRGFHIEPGAREKAGDQAVTCEELTISLSQCDSRLLAADPALKRFKSHKRSVWRLKRIGDVLTIVVVAGCCYEIYVKAVMREEARKQGSGSAQ